MGPSGVMSARAKPTGTSGPASSGGGAAVAAAAAQRSASPARGRQFTITSQLHAWDVARPIFRRPWARARGFSTAVPEPGMEPFFLSKTLPGRFDVLPVLKDRDSCREAGWFSIHRLPMEPPRAVTAPPAAQSHINEAAGR